MDLIRTAAGSRSAAFGLLLFVVSLNTAFAAPEASQSSRSQNVDALERDDAMRWTLWTTCVVNGVQNAMAATANERVVSYLPHDCARAHEAEQRVEAHLDERHRALVAHRLGALIETIERPHADAPFDAIHPGPYPGR